ncbi:GNAT family N-acetyltransferase [Leucobacter soli]|uniref:GNAT family N-acetyltransferase n=1 Tax=Leucobacter soli TaxID=2812850 RepID=UPI00361E68D0
MGPGWSRGRRPIPAAGSRTRIGADAPGHQEDAAAAARRAERRIRDDVPGRGGGSAHGLRHRWRSVAIRLDRLLDLSARRRPGITPTAVALAIDVCFGELRLHRVEICIRPENSASLRVVEKLGLRFEGRRARYICIAGEWCDHDSFAITAEEAPRGMLARLERADR